MNKKNTLFSPLFEFIRWNNFYILNSLPELARSLIKKKQKTMKPFRVLENTENHEASSTLKKTAPEY